MQNYQASLETEKRLYENCGDVHELPAIFHYWSNRYVRPKLAPLGFEDAPGMFRKYLESLFAQPGSRRFVSLGAGNCDLEIRLAGELRANGNQDFLIDCVELNATMLERAKIAAADAGIENHLNLIAADLNFWTPPCEYDAAIACHSLHHVVNLEGVFDGVKRALRPEGIFIISDMIGRNGHQRWPEALDLVNEFWRKLPPSYRYHRLLHCYEETFVNRDCSNEGFEGIRSQDILPLLIDRFHFQMFVGFANVIDPFVDRAFGPNFDAASDWDRNFIDEVQRGDEAELASGRLKPTHMMAVVSNNERGRIDLPLAFVRSPESLRAPTPVENPYAWNSWPHSDRQQLEIACAHLADSADVIRRANDWAVNLDHELDRRTEWISDLMKQLAERTEWAGSLGNDLAQHAELVTHLRAELDEKSAWAANLDAERIRIEERSRRQAAIIEQLESELEARSKWALELQKQLDDRPTPQPFLKRLLRRLRISS